MFPMAVKTRDAVAKMAFVTLREIFVRVLVPIGVRWHWNAQFPMVVKTRGADAQKATVVSRDWGPAIAPC